ncbi:tRNA lysidine(34) synthetase TilS [Stakelama saccharophila]|uniref:tRNA(Ile)-lysidine synthase n=1 Tax=Stakelama saccharophila TaxID=3075605 RepID=A0ABZ0B9B9_9SPHN|nr:tRNA lysidine(34) synthetase TilS [Stakelama sp. W311]WNO53968.1 tRNA lysidine(34) synthetase TilS [Stakelama sp. W311]
MKPPDATSAPDAAALTRFRRDFERALGRPVDRQEHVAIAVSGGPDSMALLALAASSFPGRTHAATVDHRLRPDAAAEARMVGDWCTGRGISHAVLVPSGDLSAQPSALQERARHARYALLESWAEAIGAGILATAHQADDQAETFLMRALRGAGVAGLRGIPARRDAFTLAEPARLQIVRPLLNWRRHELLNVVRDGGIPYVDDPSNADQRFERVRIRSALTEQAWLDPAALASAAAHAAEADAALDWTVERLWRERASGDPEPVLDVGGLPMELRRRLARYAILHVRSRAGITSPAFGTDANIEPLLAALTADGAATRAGILVRAKGDRWTFRPAPPRRSH